MFLFDKTKKDKDYARELLPINGDQGGGHSYGSVSEAPINLQKSSCTGLKTVGWGSLAFLASVPTGFLNFLSALNIDINSVKTLADLSSLLDEKSTGQITEAVLSALGSTGVNTAVNFVFVPRNFKAALNVLKTSGKLSANLFIDLFTLFKDNDYEKFEEINKKDFAIELFSLVYALLPGLAYAAIAYTEFQFLGAAKYVPTGLNLVSYWATRYFGISGVLHRAFDQDFKIIRELSKVVNKLDLTLAEDVEIDIELGQGGLNNDYKVQATHSIADYLQKLVNNPDVNYSKAKEILLTLANVVGVPLALFNSLPIAPVVALDTLRGFNVVAAEGFFNVDNFQKGGQLAVAYFASFANPVFYFLAAYKLLPQLIDTFNMLGNKFKDFKEAELPDKIKTGLLASIFMLASYLCYISGEGMADVSKSAIDSGYLDYMKDFINEKLYVASGYSGAACINYFSCLKVINQIFGTGFPEDLQQLQETRVNKSNIQSALDKGMVIIDVSTLKNELAIADQKEAKALFAGKARFFDCCSSNTGGSERIDQNEFDIENQNRI